MSFPLPCQPRAPFPSSATTAGLTEPKLLGRQAATLVKSMFTFVTYIFSASYIQPCLMGQLPCRSKCCFVFQKDWEKRNPRGSPGSSWLQGPCFTSPSGSSSSQTWAEKEFALQEACWCLTSIKASTSHGSKVQPGLTVLVEGPLGWVSQVLLGSGGLLRPARHLRTSKGYNNIDWIPVFLLFTLTHLLVLVLLRHSSALHTG